MSLGLIGKKLGMTRIFDEESQAMIPVTVVAVGGNTILQTKTVESDGYPAVQVGFDDQPKKERVSQPLMGHFEKHGSATAKRVVQEFRFAAGEELPAEHPGAELFAVGQYVDVTGTTKGKGFQGAVRRHGFGGLKQTHGSMMHRRTGAIGAGSWPARVWKNQQMPGHMGHDQRTIQSLKVVAVRPDDQAILIAGAVPGHKGAYVRVSSAVKKPATA